MEGDAVQSLQAEVELVEEQLGFLQEKTKLVNEQRRNASKGVRGMLKTLCRAQMKAWRS